MSKTQKGDSILGARIRELRRQKSLSLRDIGAAVHKDESTISRFETGSEPIPDDFLERFCQRVGVDKEMFQRGELSTSLLKVAAAAYSDYMFFSMICQAPAFSASAAEHLPPLSVKIEHVRFNDIPKLLKSGEVHVSLFWQEKAFSVLSSPEFAGSIVQLPVLYSIQNNPILAFAGASGAHILQTFGQLFLHNRSRGRDTRILSTLRECLGQLGEKGAVQLCLPARSDRSAMVGRLVSLALTAKPGPSHDEEKHLRALQETLQSLDETGPQDRQLNEPAAFHDFIEAARIGKRPAVFAGGLAHRLMAEGLPGVGPLLGNFALQMLTNVVPGQTNYFFPKYCLLVNRHIWEVRSQQLRTLSSRWNMAVEHVHNETMNFCWVNDFIDAEMARSHDLRKQWLAEAGFKSTAKDPLVHWQLGLRHFETILRENLIQLRRWDFEGS